MRTHSGAFACSALLAIACGGPRADADADLPGFDAGPTPPDPACVAIAEAFCECGCASGICVTRYATRFGGTIDLTWSDAASCAVSYVADWCRGTDQAPSDIEACGAAVDALDCDGGAFRPDACAPPIDDRRGAPCESDADCDEGTCVLSTELDPDTGAPRPGAGRCTAMCDRDGVVCGADCDTEAGLFCPFGWNCGTASGAPGSVCSCRPGETEEERREVCDRYDNDCSGVPDGPDADADCVARAGEGYACERGGCVPCAARCGGTCIDTDLDAAHCGGCDIACGAEEACSVGACAPFPTVVDDRTPIEHGGLSVAGGRVYFQETRVGGVFACPTGGCDGAPSLASGGRSGVRRHVVAGGDLYLLGSTGFETFGIVRCPLEGCDGGEEPIATLSALPDALAVHGDQLYFTITHASAAGLYRCPLAGCPDPVEPLSTEVGIGYPQLAVTDDGVFFSSLASPRVLRCPLDGACDAPEVVVEGDRAHVLAVQGPTLYLVYGATSSDSALARCPVDDCASPEIVRDDFLQPAVIAGERLYFMGERHDGQRVLTRCELADGCASPTRLWVTDEVRDEVVALAVDDARVYLGIRYRDGSDERGGIWSLAR